MAEAGAVVDVVGAHEGAGELLDQVVVLVRGLGAGEGAEVAAVLDELVGNEVQGLVPGGGLETAVATDEGGGEAVGVVDEGDPEAPLDAEQAEGGAVGGVVVDVSDAAGVVGAEQDAAAHAAVGADRGDGAGRGGGLLGADGAGGADGDALSAGGADRLAQGLVGERRDARRRADAGDTDRADVLQVLAGGRAAPAKDAFGGVEEVEGLLSSWWRLSRGAQRRGSAA